MLNELVYSYIRTKKMKVTEVAEDSGLSYNTVHSYLSGKYDISSSKLDHLLGSLGVSLTDLVTTLEGFEKDKAEFDLDFMNSFFKIFSSIDPISQRTSIDSLISFIDKGKKRKLKNDIMVLKNKKKSIKTIS